MHDKISSPSCRQSHLACSIPPESRAAVAARCSAWKQVRNTAMKHWRTPIHSTCKQHCRQQQRLDAPQDLCLLADSQLRILSHHLRWASHSRLRSELLALVVKASLISIGLPCPQQVSSQRCDLAQAWSTKRLPAQLSCLQCWHCGGCPDGFHDLVQATSLHMNSDSYANKADMPQNANRLEISFLSLLSLLSTRG